MADALQDRHKVSTTLGEMVKGYPAAGYSLKDDDGLGLYNFDSISEAKSGDIAFCSDPQGIDAVLKSNASLIICHSSLKDKIKGQNNYIFADNPKLDYAKMIRLLIPETFPGKASKGNSISDSAYVAPTAHVGSNVSIGDHTKVLHSAYVHDNTTIGRNCTIAPNATVGYRGFGVEYDANGETFEVPHIGRVIIGDDVEIGAGTGVDRGMLKDTIIGAGTKIDNNVQVGHNVAIGKMCAIAGGTVIGGGCTIGHSTFIGMGVMIKQHVKIGNNALLGVGSIVIRDVDSNSVVMGNPARPK